MGKMSQSIGRAMTEINKLRQRVIELEAENKGLKEQTDTTQALLERATAELLKYKRRIAELEGAPASAEPRSRPPLAPRPRQ